jgi:hypothetical protein
MAYWETQNNFFLKGEREKIEQQTFLKYQKEEGLNI